MKNRGDVATSRYRSLLVCLEPGGDNSAILHAAGEFADLFGAHVVGVGAAELPELLSDEGTAVMTVSTRDRPAIERELEKCAADFRSALQGHSLEWRSSVSFEGAADYIVRQARCADLIVSRGVTRGRACDADIGKLAIKAGRPLLLVPGSAQSFSLGRAVIAWKDTREARRAVFDAVPFLQLADQVTLLSVTGEDRQSEVQKQLAEVGQWLARHGITAEEVVVPTTASRPGYLHAELLSRRCDFLVAGAYGHTRLDEWVFGGVTRDILLEAERLTLVSH